MTAALFMEMVGWVGAALVLGAYALVSGKKLPPDGLHYQSMNIGGSVMLAAYGFWHGAIASFAVNVVWLMIGACTLLYARRRAFQAAKLS